MKRAHFVIICLVLAYSCSARTITVDDDKPAEFNRIQDAINDSNNGDIIVVADGVYTGDGNRDMDFLGKAITLRSENGPEKCIIDCNGTEAEPHRGFLFHNGEDSNSVLDGFTIRNGYEVRGGGILCFGVSPAIRNCIITNNRAEDGGGGGIYCIHCYGLTFTNCVITENLAKDGGGIFCSYGMMSIAFNDIIVTNCTFSANIAESGGAIFIGEGSNPSMVNCILRDDTASYGPEIKMDFLDWGSKLSISFSNVQGGEAAVEKAILYWGPGNIDADPCFTDPGNGDFHLKSQAGRWDANEGRWVMDEVTSPCIDAGDPMAPIGPEPFPNGGIINMGAYGGTSEASKSYFGKPPCETIVAGDINGDCRLDFEDFRIMALHWMWEY